VIRTLWRLAGLASLATLGGCDLAYPEAVVVNLASQTILLKNTSFNGCLWHGVLAYGDATAPERCLPGADRIHFQRLNAAAYCQVQSCGCTSPSTRDGGLSTSIDGGDDPSATPTWFNYQTISIEHIGYGEFRRFEITLDDMEQDFSVPGPYGH
jgi:hypothetical protein